MPTVVGVEMQGHGHTADIDRNITPAALAADVVGLLDHLGVQRAHILGHSLGAAVAIKLAVSHPNRVRSIVPISASVRPDGMHNRPEVFRGRNTRDAVWARGGQPGHLGRVSP